MNQVAELAVDIVFLICLTVLMALGKMPTDTGVPLMLLAVGVKLGTTARRGKDAPKLPPGSGGLATMVFGLMALVAPITGALRSLASSGR